MTATDNIVDRVKPYFAQAENQMLGVLQELVSIETPSRSRDAQQPLFDYLENKLNALGYCVLRMPGKESGGYLYARPQEREKGRPVQLLVGHVDTVWPTGTLDRLPFEFKGDKLRGPGVYDMKAGITQILFALGAIRDLGLSPRITPVILINSDEEIGSKDSTRAIQRLAKIANRAFVLEPPLGLDGKLKTARKGIGRFTVAVKGRAAHAGLDPTKGINAIVELSHLVQQLYALNEHERGITVNVGMIEGGISANVIAPESRAVVDVRVLHQQDGEEVERKIRALSPRLPDVEVEITGGFGRPPMEKTARNKALWEMAREQGRKLGMELEDAAVGGGSDANTTSQYTATLDGLGTPGDGAHAEHEFIFFGKLKERTALLLLILMAENYRE